MSAVGSRPGDNVRPVTARVYAPQLEFVVEKLRWESSRYNEAAALEVTGKPVDVAKLPKIGVKVVADINGTRIGAGEVDDARWTEEEKVKIAAYDAVRPLKRTTLSSSYADATAVAVARDAFNKAGVDFEIADELDYESQLRDRLDENQPDAVGTGDDTEETGAGEQTLLVTKHFNEEPCSQAIEQVARWLRAVWYVDGTNTVHLTRDPNPQDLQLHNVLKFDAGTQQSYEKVEVVGAARKIDGNDSVRQMLSKATIRAIAGNVNAPPRHTKRIERPNITSMKVAQNVADSLLEEYQRRRSSGPIELVGDERVRVFDGVTLPQKRDFDNLNGQSFIASSATQTIDDQGFKTTIGVGDPL